jgi:hypothetical protein
MTDQTPAPQTNHLEDGTVNYEDVRVVITPEAPRHYRVKVSDLDGEVSVHAVERVRINATNVRLEDPLWFMGVEIDVGVPVDEPGDTVWVWP